MASALESSLPSASNRAYASEAYNGAVFEVKKEIPAKIAEVRTLANIVEGFRRLPELLVAVRQTPVAHKLVASFLNIGVPGFPVDIPLRDGGMVRVSSRGEAKVYWQIFVHRCYRLWADC